MNPATNPVVNESAAGNGLHAVRNTGTASPHPLNSVLTEEMLARFASRAASCDRENRFADEDFEELKKTRYLLMPLPSEFGGPGMTLAEVCREQRRLAYHAPATALAVNMHLYWIGVAADLWRRGDRHSNGSCARLHPARFLPPATRKAATMCRCCFQPRKLNASTAATASPAQTFWKPDPRRTRFGLHGMDTSDPTQPKIVHAFMPRDTAGYTIKNTWDVLGMRATRSDDTLLDNVFVPDRYIARIVPAGAAGIDSFVLAVFAWALMGFANIYYGLAKRALDQSIAAVKSKGSLALSRSLAYHPEVQHAIADMVIELESIGPHLESVAEDWSHGVDHGAQWPSKIFAAKYHAVEGSWRVVDLGLDVSGGHGIFRSAGYERLLRDARLGRIHPANSFLTHEVVAKTALEISLDEQPRWG